MAIESGAISKNVSGSTLNLTTSPYALVAGIRGDTSQTYEQFSGFTRIGVSAAFNVQNQDDPLASVQRKNLAEWSVKVRLLGDHSPRSKEAHAEFTNVVLPSLQEKANSLAKALRDVLTIGERAKLIRDFSAAANAKINEYLDDPSYNSARAEEDIGANHSQRRAVRHLCPV